MQKLSAIAYQEKKFLLCIFLVSILVRVLFFLCYLREDQRYMLAFDSVQYQKIAENIAHGDGISTEPGVPNFYRLPGYPIFLAVCYKIFGVDNIKTMLVQIFFASFIPGLIFLLALILFPPSIMIAKIASVLSVFHLGFVMYSGTFASESLFLLFFLLFLIFFFSSFEAEKKSCLKSLCFSGVFLGIASLLRAVGHYLIVLALVILFILTQKTMGEKIKNGISLSLGWLLVVSWWLARNYLLAGYIFFHTLPGLHFLQYSAVHAEMGYVNFGDTAYFATKDRLLHEWKNQVAQNELREGHELNEYERYAVAGQLAVLYLLKSPLIAFKNACVQMVRTCCTLHTSLLLYVPAGTVYEKSMSLWSKIRLYLTPQVVHDWLVPVIYYDVFMLFFMYCGCLLYLLRALFNRASWRKNGTLFGFIGVLIFLTLGYGCARLRLPIEPLLIIFSVVGWIDRSLV